MEKVKHELAEGFDDYECSCGKYHVRGDDYWGPCSKPEHGSKCRIVHVDVGESELQVYHDISFLNGPLSVGF